MANGEFEMKITKRQLRRIIKEEKAREFPIHLYSREELLQEGLFDFLGKMWGKLKGVMQKGYDKATASVKSAYSDAMKGVDASKLDPKKPDTYKDLALKWGTIDAESLSKINEWLDKAADIENWTPPLDDADQEASTNLWKSVGALQEMVKGWSQYVDGVGLDKTKGSPENPAEATMWCGELLGEVIDVWEWLYKNVKADHVEKSAKSISEYAKSLREFLHDINIQIKADAEEQQNEWVDLRYTVGGMLSEKRQSPTIPALEGKQMKITRRQLRRLIREMYDAPPAEDVAVITGGTYGPVPDDVIKQVMYHLGKSDLYSAGLPVIELVKPHFAAWDDGDDQVLYDGLTKILSQMQYDNGWKSEKKSVPDEADVREWVNTWLDFFKEDEDKYRHKGKK
jgi:hypothetical protein